MYDEVLLYLFLFLSLLLLYFKEWKKHTPASSNISLCWIKPQNSINIKGEKNKKKGTGKDQTNLPWVTEFVFSSSEATQTPSAARSELKCGSEVYRNSFKSALYYCGKKTNHFTLIWVTCVIVQIKLSPQALGIWNKKKPIRIKPQNGNPIAQC